jgi:hypothetical protein
VGRGASHRDPQDVPHEDRRHEAGREREDRRKWCRDERCRDEGKDQPEDRRSALVRGDRDDRAREDGDADHRKGGAHGREV